MINLYKSQSTVTKGIIWTIATMFILGIIAEIRDPQPRSHFMESCISAGYGYGECAGQEDRVNRLLSNQ